MKKGKVNPVMIIAVAVFLFGGLLAYWQYNVKEAAQARYQQLEAEVPTKEEVDAELAQTSQDLEKYRENLAHLEKSVPPQAYVPTMLSELESLGKLNRIAVTGVRPVAKQAQSRRDQENEQQNKKAYQEVEIDITGTGQYNDVMALVDQLKGFPKIVAVRTVSLTPKKEANAAAQGILESTIRLRAYVFAAPTPNNKPESGLQARADIHRGP
ncbi:MAG: type 4a pilus biogenesis protein PilO [Fimbriimonadaceae bacterium]|nr:type 4a pilus biogenesis protein PilO [Fimbriimonadaceae bacterium]